LLPTQNPVLPWLLQFCVTLAGGQSRYSKIVRTNLRVTMRFYWVLIADAPFPAHSLNILRAKGRNPSFLDATGATFSGNEPTFSISFLFRLVNTFLFYF